MTNFIHAIPNGGKGKTYTNGSPPEIVYNPLPECGSGVFLGDLRIDACGIYNGNLSVGGNLNVTGITTSLIFDALGTSSSDDDSVDDFIVDSSQIKYHHHKASFTGTKKFQISNLTDGRSIYLYLTNTNVIDARTMQIEASTTTSGYISVPLSQSGSSSVSSTTLSSSGGTATVWVVNINGNISGALY